MVHHFDLPFEPLSLRPQAGETEEPSKRKRNASRSSSQSDDDGQNEIDRANIAHHDTLEPQDQEAEEHEDVVPPDFPHAPLKESFEFSPLPKLDLKTHSLRQQHLDVLTTILHKSLLDHDFDRAERTFGMLLRVEYGGKHVDLRKKRLWGIAAEILLHRKAPRAISGKEHEAEDREAIDRPDTTSTGFTQEGYTAARAFYDRLILQYPYKKSRPHDINAVTFYPSMFGLWIAQIQDSVKEQLADQRDQTRSRSGSSSLYTRSRSAGSRSRSTSPSRSDANCNHIKSKDERRRREVKANELRQARDVAERLDQLTLLPPYDQDTQLLQLKGMIALWVADLVHNIGEGEEAESEQREKAVASFQKVKQCGGQFWEGVAHLIDE